MTSELDDLDHAMDLANKVTFTGLASGAKVEALQVVSRMRNKLDALESKAITAFEATAEYRAEGHASTIGWLRHHRHAKAADASRRRGLARACRRFPLAADALAAGEITAEHVVLLDRACRREWEDAFTAAEPELVAAAAGGRYLDFEQLVRAFVDRLDPTAADDKAKRAIEDRWARLSDSLDAAGHLEGWFPDTDKQILRAELERIYHQLLDADRAEARDRLGRDPLPSELARTHANRMADAVIVMAQRSAAHPGDDLGAASVPAVTIHLNASMLMAFLKALAAQRPIEVPDDALVELDDGTPVAPATAFQALLVGFVNAVIYGDEGEILHYGRRRRLFSPPQAAALRAKYRRCTHPYGCDNTGPLLQSDHIVEHQDGGPTDIDNGQPRDGPHNRWKTNTRHKPPPPDNGTPPDTAQQRHPRRITTTPHDPDSWADDAT